jgi:hypothetical protein
VGTTARDAGRVTYLLDSDVFIEAKKRYYGFDICPGFWAYLEREMTAGNVRSIEAVKAELLAKADELSTWATNHSDFFDPPTAGFAASMAALSTWVTGPGLTYSQAAIQQFLALADSQLVAHAHSEVFTLVSDEGSHPLSVARVMIPDACNALNVPCISTFELLRRENVSFRL